jgi:hypothetical protein
VPPVPKDLLIEQEDKLTGEAYLRQLMSTYGLTLPPEQVQPFVDIRERMKGSAEWPRWVRSFVSSYYAIWSQPVVQDCRWSTNRFCSWLVRATARLQGAPSPNPRTGTAWGRWPSGQETLRHG